MSGKPPTWSEVLFFLLLAINANLVACWITYLMGSR